MKYALITILCMLVIAGAVFFVMQNEGDVIPALPQISSPTPVQSSQPASPPATIEIAPPPEDSPDTGVIVDVNCPFYEAGLPILVNRDKFIPDGYDPEIREIANGYYLNRRAANAWEEMRAAALADGVSIWTISAYRSHEAQTINFQSSVERHIAAGRSPQEAHALTVGWIAYPGTSEHELGLAIDINSIDTAFEETAEFAWLIENCANFGFILRYPKDKVDITNINYEPWHYRYVGSNHARVIMERGISLEEYLQ